MFWGGGVMTSCYVIFVEDVIGALLVGVISAGGRAVRDMESCFAI
jgi:hypothetical protein